MGGSDCGNDEGCERCCAWSRKDSDDRQEEAADASAFEAVAAAGEIRYGGRRQQQGRQTRLQQREEKAEIKATLKEGLATVKKRLGRGGNCGKGKHRKRAGRLLWQGRRWLAVSGSGRAEATAREGLGSGIRQRQREEDSSRGLAAEGTTGRRQQPMVKDGKGERLLQQGRQRHGWATMGQRRMKVAMHGWSSGRGGCGLKDVAATVVEEREMMADGLEEGMKKACNLEPWPPTKHEYFSENWK
ncbi:hypothetical protein BHE74_00008744 [Ensete ventricosum]|nr:hypothetical protein BHE74_00008744 [Ensete ventricosum]